MAINSINGLSTGLVYESNTTKKSDKSDASKAVANSKENAAAGKATTAKEETGVTYESKDIKKMSKEDRSRLVTMLKEEQAKRQSDLVNLVKDTILKQGTNFAISNNDDIWKFLAEGNFTVDEETKKSAQEAISEDGYWGVKNTSQRIFDFAMSLSGGDEKKMKEMQAAFEKGFKEAAKAWGDKDLPGISNDTYDAVNKKFEDYYADSSKEV